MSILVRLCGMIASSTPGVSRLVPFSRVYSEGVSMHIVCLEGVGRTHVSNIPMMQSKAPSASRTYVHMRSLERDKRGGFLEPVIFLFSREYCSPPLT